MAHGELIEVFPKDYMVVRQAKRNLFATMGLAACLVLLGIYFVIVDNDAGYTFSFVISVFLVFVGWFAHGQEYMKKNNAEWVQSKGVLSCDETMIKFTGERFPIIPGVEGIPLVEIDDLLYDESRTKMFITREKNGVTTRDEYDLRYLDPSEVREFTREAQRRIDARRSEQADAPDEAEPAVQDERAEGNESTAQNGSTDANDDDASTVEAPATEDDENARNDA